MKISFTSSKIFDNISSKDSVLGHMFKIYVEPKNFKPKMLIYSYALIPIHSVRKSTGSVLNSGQKSAY